MTVNTLPSCSLINLFLIGILTLDCKRVMSQHLHLTNEEENIDLTCKDLSLSDTGAAFY